MASNLTIMGNKEILLVAENIANEKGISNAEILGAMEEGIKVAAKKKYGTHLDIDCKIDKKSGQIKLFNKIEIVGDDEEDIDSRTQIKVSESDKADAQIGEFIEQELPPMDLNRVVAQVARNEIIQKVKEAEKNKEYQEFKDKVGNIISASVKKVGIKNIVMEVEGFEAVIHETGLIPRENFRVGDRMRCYIEDVRQEPNGAQIFLSRTHPQFLVKLFEQEVPELYEGNIEVKAVARDAGSRAKIAIYSTKEDLDIVGSMIGIRGSRVQSVSAELRGEKIDILRWSSNIGEMVVSALTPAKISKVVVDEEKSTIEVVVPEDQLSVCIGRGGQNVKLASKLLGYKIDIMTDEQESTKRQTEFTQASDLFTKALDVEDMIANLLASEGFLTIEDLIDAEVSEIASIEGFDEDVAREIKNRAEEFLANGGQINEEELDESEKSKEEIEEDSTNNEEAEINNEKEGTVDKED